MKKANKMTALAAACVLAAWLGGCCDECKENKEGHTTVKASTEAPVNTECPYSHRAVNTATAVSYKGQSVAFCCEGCAGKWAGASEGEKDRMLSAVTKH